MNEIIKIINPLENPVVLIDGVSETVKHEIKKKNVDFLVMLLEMFCASMLGNMFTGKCVMRAKRKRYNIDKNC